MRRQLFLLGGAAAALAMSLAGCGKEDAHDGTTFDASYIAAEADRGNLGPLRVLVEACKSEVEAHRRRGEACKQLDHVRELRKPLNIGF